MQTGLVVLLAQARATAAVLAGGIVEVRTGIPEASPQSPDRGVLLGQCRFGSPAFLEPRAERTDARLDAASIADDLDALADGKAGHFRAKTADGRVAFQGSISEPGGGGDAIMQNVNIQKRGRIQIGSLTYIIPM